MNAEICTDYFSFVLLVLKYVEQLVPQITFSLFFIFFNFQEKQKSKPQTESVILAWICFFQNCKNTEHSIIDRVSNRKENLSKDSHILFLCNSLRRKNCCFMFIFFPSSELKLNSSLIWFLSYFIYHILVEKAARTLMFYISWCVCKIKGSKHTDDCQFTLSVEDY